MVRDFGTLGLICALELVRARACRTAETRDRDNQTEALDRGPRRNQLNY